MRTRKNYRFKGGFNAILGEHQLQPIHIAAQSGTADEIRALVAAGVDINTPAYNGGWTPLHIAAAKCRPDIVGAILDISGADINAAPRQNYGTPLYAAIHHNCLPVVERLLQDPRIQVNNGQFPTSRASSLSDAINNRVDERIIAALLAHPNIDVNATHLQQVPLYNAVVHDGRTSVVRMILNAPGINVNPVGLFGQTPLGAALMHGDVELLPEFFSHPEVNIQHPDIIENFNHFPLTSKQALVEEYERRNIPLPVHWNMNAPNNNSYNSNYNSNYNSSNNYTNAAQYNLNYTNIRNVPANAMNAISMDSIEDGEQMVTFHGNLNRMNGKRFYKRATFNSLVPNSFTGYKKNPFTRENIKPANVRGYTARKVGGKKYKKRKTFKKSHAGRP